MMPSCSAGVMACQRPSLIIICFRSSHDGVSVTSRSAPFASLVTPSLWHVSHRKHDHAVRRFETIGIRLVFAGGWAFVKSKMAILNGRYLDIYVLIDQPGADIMTQKHFGYRHSAASIGNSDFRAD